MTARKPAAAPLDTPAFPYQLLDWRALDTLVPYARNARTHSEAQVAQIAASIEEFGFAAPVLADERGIVAGHGRVLAARRLHENGRAIRLPNGTVLPAGFVPVLDCSGWSEAQRRAYVIADNKLAEHAGWDASLLRLELEDLEAEEFDTSVLAFGDDELADVVFGDWGASESALRYVPSVTAPVYTPKGDKPALAELADLTKSDALVQAIRDAADISEDERAFLLLAAARHTVFDYHRIAEYYCHASAAMQSHMEASALIIIDFEQAIERGFVRMTERLGEVFAQSIPEDDAGEGNTDAQ
jgi:hypothetical protein